MATFQVSDKTQKILKNFAGISNSIILAEGKSQRVIAKGRSVLGLAELPEAWPRETAIYDLNRFLATLSIFKTPAITFAEDRMTIRDAQSRIGFRYSDPTTITAAPSKTLPTNDPQVKFTMSEATLEQLSKAAATLELDTVSIVVEDGKVVVGAADAKNPASHDYAFEVTEADLLSKPGEFTRTQAFSTEHIAMLLTGSYEVSMSDWNYGFFVHKTEPVSYYIVGQA
jgi:hypothetical protein